MKSMPIQGENLDKVAEALRRTSLFRKLNDEQLRGVAGQAQLLLLEPGEELVRQDEGLAGLAVVLSGELRALQRSERSGEPYEVARFAPFESVGIAGLLLATSSPLTIAAAARSTVVRLEPRSLELLAEQTPGLGLEMARVLAERLVRAVGHIPIPEADAALVAQGGLLDLLPRDLMARVRAVPLAARGQVLTLGLADEPTPELLERVRTHLPGMELRPVRLTSRQLDELLGSRAGIAAPPSGAPAADPELLEKLLRAMVAEGASDLHLAGGQRPRWRIDGEMREISDAPELSPEGVLELLGPALPERNRQEFAASNDTDFAHAISDLARFRINLFRDIGGVGAVFRQIPNKVIGLEQLGMPPVVSRFCALPKGLVLVTGPTGSGKSTTLAAMVDLINRTRGEHIITLEDPVEFVHGSGKAMVNQREVGAHTSSFSRALRAALRQDPDIILVGEMRDLETVSMAIETANTGHLVFGTLHTSTAMSTVDRIVSMFPTEQQNTIRATLSDVLKGVVSQNLLRRIGGGRVAALEIMVVNSAVANLIREGKTHQVGNAMQTGKAAGNQLLNDSLAALVNAKTVEVRERSPRRRQGRPGAALQPHRHRRLMRRGCSCSPTAQRCPVRYRSIDRFARATDGEWFTSE
jgi:twitching motility protein PilT